MKILFVSEYYPPKISGGGEINLAQIAEELARQQQEVLILTSFFPDLPPEEVRNGVTIHRRLRSGKTASTLKDNFQRRFLFPSSLVREIIPLVEEQKPDVIHFIGSSIIAAPQLKKRYREKLAGVKLVATIESYPTLCPKGDRLYHGREECRIACTFNQFFSCQSAADEIGKMSNRWYLRYNPLFLGLTYRYYQQLHKALSSCQLIAISGYVQRLLQQQGWLSTVIPNAFEAAPFSVQIHSIPERTHHQYSKNTSNHNSNHKPVILYVGALIKSKGPQILLGALKGINCRIELYGEGILKEQLQQAITANNLDAKIFPPVPYDQMPRVYARADVVVFPSLWPEPFGRIPLEAMAAGKPIIASRTGAIPEIIREENCIGKKKNSIGEKNLLVPPGDSVALQEAILFVLPQLSSQKKFKSSSLLLQEYEPTKIAARLQQIYEKPSGKNSIN